MMEIFEDFTVIKNDYKEYFMIPKREHNPQLSILGNMALDFVDFKDRVKPLAHDISRWENTTKYEKQPLDMFENRNTTEDLLEGIDR